MKCFKILIQKRDILSKVYLIAIFCIYFYLPLHATVNCKFLKYKTLDTYRNIQFNTINKQQNSKEAFFNTLEVKISPIGSVKELKITSISNTSLKSRYLIKKIKHDLNPHKSLDSIYSEKANYNDFKVNDIKIKFEKPLLGKVSSRFGYRRHPLLYKTHGTFFHTGIDIPAKRGTPIRASASGKVVYAGWRKGYGLLVEIDHGNGFKTLYAHCSKLLVKVGTYVTTKTTIALVGSTGVTTGPHLHFEIKQNNKPLNPILFVSY